MSAVVVLGVAVVVFTYIHRGNVHDKALADAERRSSRSPRGRRDGRGIRQDRGDGRWNR